LACYNFDAREWILIFFGGNVTDKVGNQKTLYYATSNMTLCSLPRSCLVQPVDRFDSEEWFISDQVIFLTVFRAFGEKACSI